MRHFIESFQESFRRKDPGLVLAGIDFAIATVGGAFGDQVLLGVQDLNVSFTGAECLRVFLEKARKTHQERGRYGLTRVYRPLDGADHDAFLKVTAASSSEAVRCDTIASIPGHWAMVGMSGGDPADAMENLRPLESALLEQGLIAET